MSRTERAPQEVALQLGSVIKTLGDALAIQTAPLALVAQAADGGPVLSFPIFSALCATAQLFDKDPEFMHWLFEQAGIFDNPQAVDVEPMIAILKQAVEEIEREYAAQHPK